ncbi:MAG: response regulator [Syntrophales bacterium]|jgi:phosphate regulon transcriptional regulator PhoB|nr:response regulator [Syntrophales bacterium]MDD4340180.1 response regulator [Syntrophales bacterium]HOG08124.1 response regulator [Syntrophales bacterium]HOS77680.1 response regulator [Syntrophales bacterium]HPB70664.1 response regulator [Syntrophales bacterium]
MTRKIILIADDERDIVELIAYNLEREGFSVLKAYDGKRAWDRTRQSKPDLVLLDLMMPGTPGMDVCRAIRGHAETSAIPVIMLTAKAEPVDKILGLELGADDYITKPFHVRELIARVRAVLRRTKPRPEDETPEAFDFRGLHIDFGTYRVTVDGRPVELSTLEFKLLKFLTGRPGRVFSREQLLDRVWGDEAFVEPRTVDVHISRLRAAIEADKETPRFILTVRGIGYKFADADA